MGGYAKCDIRKGTRIIEYIGRPLTKKKAQKELEDGNGYVFTINKHFDIDGSVEWNPARFINHSCDPNAESDIVDDRVWIDAIKKRNDYIPIEVHWSEVPGRDDNWKEQTIRNTSPEQFQQEFECEFLGSVNTLISAAKIKALPYLTPLKLSLIHI